MKLFWKRKMTLTQEEHERIMKRVWELAKMMRVVDDGNRALLNLAGIIEQPEIKLDCQSEIEKILDKKEF